MRASFRKRLKWYGGIFFIASLVFGVNIFQYDKVKFSYELRKITKCSKKYFLLEERKQAKTNPFADIKPLEERKKGKYDDLKPIKPRMFDDLKPKAENKYLSMTREPKTMADKYRQSKLQSNNPRNGLSQSQITQAESKYKLCLERNQKSVQEAKSKKERTEISLGIGGFLMALMASVSFIDFIIFLVRNRKLKIRTGEVIPMENKKITKIAILSFIVWGIISFLIAQSGYRHKFHVDTFLMLNIPSLLIVGYLWIADKFTLK